jgi:hypothetical protein
MGVTHWSFFNIHISLLRIHNISVICFERPDPQHFRGNIINRLSISDTYFLFLFLHSHSLFPYYPIQSRMWKSQSINFKLIYNKYQYKVLCHMNYDIDNKKYNINELKNLQSIFPTRIFKILIQGIK